MSELDKSLQELGDDLRSSITPPDLRRIAGRARQRSTRRRMQVGAIAAVVAVSAAVPALRTMPEAPPAGPPERSRVTYELDFADAEHGYALRTECRVAERCTYTLLATTDGGRSWRPRQLPADDGRYDTASLSVYGPDRLLFNGIRHDPEPFTGTFFSSEDGGRTWRESEFAPEKLAEPRVIPPGAWLFPMCSQTAAAECDPVIGWQDDRTAAPVLTQPPLVAAEPGREATAGGRHWVIGRDPASRQLAVSVTADDGETWATSPLDVPGELWRREPWSVVEHDGTLYVTLVGSVEAGPVGLLAVFRSTDGGRSWTRTWQQTETNRLANVYGDAVATADGRLLLYSTTEGTLESEDGGRTFTKADRQLAGPVTWTRGGYLAKGTDGYEISSDGLDWRRFELP